MKIHRHLITFIAAITATTLISSCSIGDYYKAAETPGQKAMVVALSPFIAIGAGSVAISEGGRTETKEGRLFQAMRVGNYNIAKNLIDSGVKVDDKKFFNIVKGVSNYQAANNKSIQFLLDNNAASKDVYEKALVQRRVDVAAEKAAKKEMLAARAESNKRLVGNLSRWGSSISKAYSDGIDQQIAKKNQVKKWQCSRCKRTTHNKYTPSSEMGKCLIEGHNLYGKISQNCYWQWHDDEYAR